MTSPIDRLSKSIDEVHQDITNYARSAKLGNCDPDNRDLIIERVARVVFAWKQLSNDQERVATSLEVQALVDLATKTLHLTTKEKTQAIWSKIRPSMLSFRKTSVDPLDILADLGSKARIAANPEYSKILRVETPDINPSQQKLKDRLDNYKSALERHLQDLNSFASSSQLQVWIDEAEGEKQKLLVKKADGENVGDQIADYESTIEDLKKQQHEFALKDEFIASLEALLTQIEEYGENIGSLSSEPLEELDKMVTSCKEDMLSIQGYFKPTSEESVKQGLRRDLHRCMVRIYASSSTEDLLFHKENLERRISWWMQSPKLSEEDRLYLKKMVEAIKGHEISSKTVFKDDKSFLIRCVHRMQEKVNGQVAKNPLSIKESEQLIASFKDLKHSFQKRDTASHLDTVDRALEQIQKIQNRKGMPSEVRALINTSLDEIEKASLLPEGEFQTKTSTIIENLEQALKDIRKGPQERFLVSLAEAQIAVASSKQTHTYKRGKIQEAVLLWKKLPLEYQTGPLGAELVLLIEEAKKRKIYSYTHQSPWLSIRSMKGWTSKHVDVGSYEDNRAFFSASGNLMKQLPGKIESAVESLKAAHILPKEAAFIADVRAETLFLQQELLELATKSGDVQAAIRALEEKIKECITKIDIKIQEAEVFSEAEKIEKLNIDSSHALYRLKTSLCQNINFNSALPPIRKKALANQFLDFYEIWKKAKSCKDPKEALEALKAGLSLCRGFLGQIDELKDSEESLRLVLLGYLSGCKELFTFCEAHLQDQPKEAFSQTKIKEHLENIYSPTDTKSSSKGFSFFSGKSEPVINPKKLSADIQQFLAALAGGLSSGSAM